jgi:hypothetical protein
MEDKYPRSHGEVLSRQFGRGVMAVTMNVVLSIPEMCCPVSQEDALSLRESCTACTPVSQVEAQSCQSGSMLFCQPGTGDVLPVSEICCPVTQRMVMSCQGEVFPVSQKEVLSC